MSGTDQGHVVAELDVAGAHAARWRAALDGLWRRKLEEAVALSTACDGAAGGGGACDPAVLPTPRLQDRATRAFEDLAAIEDAIARIDDGSYGLCTACGQRMPDEWLAEEPQVQRCPDCAAAGGVAATAGQTGRQV